jgi:hypothetical protein
MATAAAALEMVAGDASPFEDIAAGMWILLHLVLAEVDVLGRF